MILEGLVTTRNEDGTVNIAPMGPRVDGAGTSLLLRPFQTSTTYRNLKRDPQGVFHVSDDSLLLARAAVNVWDGPVETFPAEKIAGEVLKTACRWYEFVVEELDDREPRTNIQVRIVHTGRLRDFFGWNRAKHAVLEAAILATRVHILDAEDIRQQLGALKILVEKTAGPEETQAFGILEEYVHNHIAAAQSEPA